MRQTRASARLAESAKAEPAIPAPEADTNYVDKSDDDYSEEDEVVKAPKRKRARNSQVSKAPARKKHVRGKQGRLEGLMNMPIDIFTEIALYLMPGDIITLARSNKFFRNLLMHRPAAHIWHGAMRNVPELPPCPPDMCEPQYLSLIFSRTCSMCGGTCIRRMDEILRVRLCASCRSTSAVALIDLTLEFLGLVHVSSKLVPNKRRWGADQHALRDDVDLVRNKLETLDGSELKEWKEQRLKAVRDRSEQSEALGHFLDSVDCNREDELSQLRREFRSQVETRLLKSEWREKDLDIQWNFRREWNTLVEQPRVLTDRIWANIKPKLIPVLEKNRTARLEKEMADRKASRKARLMLLLGNINLDTSPLVQATIPRPANASVGSFSPSANSSTVEISHKGVFPDFVDALEWPVFKNLYETDVPLADMQAQFEEHRGEINTLISDWKSRVIGRLAEVLRNGREFDDLPEEAPDPILPVEESEPNPFQHLSGDQKILYRADSFFESLKGKSQGAGSFFDTIVSSGYSMSFIGFSMRHIKNPLNLTTVKWHAEAQAAARILLAALGKPDACFLEMKIAGQMFACGRCHEGSPRTWEEMVHHYVFQKRQLEDIQPAFEKANVTFINVHDPNMETAKPLVKIFTPQDLGVGSFGAEPNRVCKVCTKIPGVPVVRSAESKIITHVKEVHGIAEPKLPEHYSNYFDLPGLLTAMFNDDPYGDSDEDVFGFMGPGYDSEEELYGIW